MTVDLSRSVCNAATPLMALTADRGKVRHAYFRRPPSSCDQRHSRDELLVVPRIAHPHLIEEAAVDLVDDLQMPRQQPFEQRATDQVSSASGSRV
jgi:hypothetical protein